MARYKLLLLLLLPGCATTYYEVTGTCVIQEWALSSIVMRTRRICDLPPPDIDAGDPAVRDRPAMNVNPFPNLFEDNEADTTDPNLLEKARLRRLYEEAQTDEQRAEILFQYLMLNAD